MKKIVWSYKSTKDISRIYNFLAEKDFEFAERIIQSITKSVTKLTLYPQLGEKLEIFPRQNIRRFFVENYEIRYEITGNIILILQVWHTREKR